MYREKKIPKEFVYILHEDNHLIVVNKPSGALVQGDKTEDKPLSEDIKEYIKEKYNKPGEVFCGVVHRLDRPVSGVLLFARTSKALERMNKLFHDKEVTKVYWALVTKKPEEDEATLVHYLTKDTEKNRTKASLKPNKGQRAELSYKIIGKVSTYYLLEVRPKTGRPHQIRVQLAKIGCPIKGDLKYGSDSRSKGRIHLHSRKLEFIHPVKKEPISIEAPLPKDQIWQLFSDLASTGI